MIYTNIVRKPLTEKEINHYSIDSLRIRIPYLQVDITSRELDKLIYEITEDGEILNNSGFKKNSLRVQNEGFDFYFRVEKIPMGKSGVTNKFLTVLINSKMIKKDYFYAINKLNIRFVYTMLINLKVFNCSYDTFKKSNCSDVDIKIDGYCDIDTFKNTINELKDIAKLSIKNHEGCNWFKGNSNLGIEFNTRERATISSPYFKIYHKEIELKERSKYFSDLYLKEIDYHNVVRFEFTLKNKKMMNAYGVESTTLEYLLDISQEKCKIIHKEFLKRNFNKRTKMTNDKEKGIGTKDIMLTNLMKHSINNNMSFERFKFISMTGIECRIEKGRANKKLDELYSIFKESNDAFKRSEKNTEFMSFLGAGDSDFFLDL